MPHFSRRGGQRGQTRQELFWVILISGIALFAMLSVFVPFLRNMWLGIGRLVLG